MSNNRAPSFKTVEEHEFELKTITDKLHMFSANDLARVVKTCDLYNDLIDIAEYILSETLTRYQLDSDIVSLSNQWLEQLEILSEQTDFLKGDQSLH